MSEYAFLNVMKVIAAVRVAPTFTWLTFWRYGFVKSWKMCSIKKRNKITETIDANVDGKARVDHHLQQEVGFLGWVSETA